MTKTLTGALIVLALLIPACAEPKTLVGQVNPVTVTGLGLPEFGQPDGAIGQLAPALSGLDFDGNEVTISGGPHLILFAAHWCSHCQAEVPEVVSWLEAGSLPSNIPLTVISTAVDITGPNFPPSEWLSDFPQPVLVDSEQRSAAGAYGLTSFPYWVAIDADGNVAWRQPGRVPTELLDLVVAEIGG